MNTFVIKQRLTMAKAKLAELESAPEFSKELADFHHSLIDVLDKILEDMNEIQKRLGSELRP